MNVYKCNHERNQKYTKMYTNNYNSCNQKYTLRMTMGAVLPKSIVTLQLYVTPALLLLLLLLYNYIDIIYIYSI